MKKFIVDPRLSYPVEVDHIPSICDELMWWKGELREVAEIHQSPKGIQVELVR